MAFAVTIALLLFVVALSHAMRDGLAGCGLGIVLCLVVWVCRGAGAATGGPAGAIGGVCFSFVLVATFCYWTDKKRPAP